VVYRLYLEVVGPGGFWLFGMVQKWKTDIQREIMKFRDNRPFRDRESALSDQPDRLTCAVDQRESVIKARHMLNCIQSFVKLAFPSSFWALMDGILDFAGCARPSFREVLSLNSGLHCLPDRMSVTQVWAVPSPASTSSDNSFSSPVRLLICSFACFVIE
jgi:hypothetical protein